MFLKKSTAILLAFALVYAMSMPALAEFNVTNGRYVVQKENEFTANFDKNRELKLDKKLFKAMLGDDMEEVSYITILETPPSDLATLYYGKIEVIPLDSYKMGAVGSLKLKGTGKSVPLTFIAHDKDGEFSPVSRLTVNPSAESMKPTSKDIVLETGMGLKVGGQLQAVDPRGEGLIYEILSAPVKGDIHYSSVSSSFIYTPHAERMGSDSFTYSVRNSSGERSPVSKVSLKIHKLKDKGVFYADMNSSTNHFAAIQLAEMGVFRGERVGGTDFLNPEKAVSRGEFLVMLMNASKLDVHAPVISNTAVEAESDMPMWMKNYFASAVAAGIVTGDGAALNASAEITRAEAAVMLCNLFPKMTENISAETFSVIDEVPTWAEIAVNALEQNHIMVGDGTGNVNANGILTREAAISILWRILGSQGA